jgi:DNA-binding GntR family transcriptional regulator
MAAIVGSQTDTERTRIVRAEGTNTRGHLTDSAYAYMKERLLEGHYSPRERISPEDVMEAIGTSRQPVMDAMRRLSVEGFVKVVPQVGCLVAVPDARDVADFLRLLASLEGTCLEMAAERATDEEIDVLKRTVTNFMSVANGQLNAEQLGHEFRLHNREFHHQLYSIAHSDVVSNLVVSLSDRADFYIANAFGTHSFGVRFHQAVEEHRRIAEVLSWRDPVAGRRVIESHVIAFIDALGAVAGDGGQVGA